MPPNTDPETYDPHADPSEAAFFATDANERHAECPLPAGDASEGVAS